MTCLRLEPPRRFLIECFWHGPSGTKVCHRKVYPGSEKKLRAWADKAGAVTFTDGTRMSVRVRDCELRERIKDERNGYDKLLRDLCWHDVTEVAQLPQRASAPTDRNSWRVS